MSTQTVATTPQHVVALQRANEIRLARAVLKKEVARGERTASEVIETCPWEAAAMTIFELLTSQRRWGNARASKFLAAIGMPETKTLRSFTDRQRDLLARMLLA